MTYQTIRRNGFESPLCSQTSLTTLPLSSPYVPVPLTVPDDLWSRSTKSFSNLCFAFGLIGRASKDVFEGTSESVPLLGWGVVRRGGGIASEDDPFELGGSRRAAKAGPVLVGRRARSMVDAGV